jgi:putative copper export protein/mono/diheme cytochrome c family protein
MTAAENFASEALIAARALHLASTAILAGLFLFLFFIGEPAFRRSGCAPASLRRTFLRLAWSSLALALASGAAWFLLVAFDLAGHSWEALVSQAIPSRLLIATRFGNNALVRLGLAVLLSICLLRFRSDRGWRSRSDGLIASVLAAGFAASLAWTGHGGAGSGALGEVQLVADALHSLAAASWIGALPPLLLLLARARRIGGEPSRAMAAQATWRFSQLGIVSVCVLLATGIVNTCFLVGSMPGLVGTEYGRLLLAKVALFAAMVCLAGANRFRLLPRLIGSEKPGARVLGHIEHNGFIELLLGLVVLIIVGVLGSMPPAAHVQPWWPFPLRLSTDALQDSGGGLELVGALAALGVGLLAMVLAVAGKRWRWPIAAGAIMLIAWGGTRLSLFTAEAFPTSFFVSPTGYSARSIAVGKTLFAQHCAACHGEEGRGDGPAAQGLDPPPSDLTAEHIYGHSDGDLFWWISHGIGDAMPGFDTVLDETARWNLVDFLHANADAKRLIEAASATAVALPIPQFSVECPDGSIVSIDRLRGKVVHLVFAGPASADRLRQLANMQAEREILVVRQLGSAVPFCGTQDPDVNAVFALYRGNGEIGGTEFLIDESGWLRAMWFPGRRPDWEIPTVLAGEIDAIRRTPGRLRFSSGSGAHLHSH